VRLSQKSATVAEFRRFLVVFGDSLTFLRQCGQGLSQHTDDARSVMPDLQLGTLFLTLKKTVHFLCLLSDVSLNISTSHITSTLSAFWVILQLPRYINYLLVYLLTY